MASANDTLKIALKQPFDTPVYYFASSDEALLQEAAATVRRALLAAGADTETTVVYGPAPDLGEVVAAAGAISFFGTPRIVEVRGIAPPSMGDKDAAELAAVFTDTINAVLIVTAIHKDKKTAGSKKAKALLAAAAEAGVALELSAPTRRDYLRLLNREAEALGASFAPGAAELLLERAGEDRALLRNETAKLAAFSGYGTITEDIVARFSVHNIEADVFELIRLITAGRKAAAHQKLADLLALRHEPVALSAALAGSYADMMRVRWGGAAGHGTGDVMRDFGYRGSDYRLKKARESAARYPAARLEEATLLLAGLDKALKSSALPDKSLLLQAAVGRLIQLGAR
ncbi:MAG: DNA polymerase III subunit delta [Ruminococcaceae bacterium]|nr:DNA polymerase III subunit delta [Oscillospiraceae bacterium]